jgi:hypothetical protein
VTDPEARAARRGPAAGTPLGEYRILPGVRSWWGRSLLVVAGVVLVLAALVALAVFVFVGVSVVDETRFDGAAWRAAGPVVTGTRTSRGRMHRSLLERHLRPGMQRDEVFDLLGAPDELRGTVPACFTAIWRLGWDGSLFVPSQLWLVLEFEQDILVWQGISDD